MIDFRYHLVSLISVFLALAVGIILGAGPLQGAIGDQLIDQVEALRTERNTLREELDQAQGDVDEHLRFLQAAGPRLVEGSLQDRTVALVDLGEMSRDVKADLVDQLEAAGATVVTDVALTESWTLEDEAPFRETLASGLDDQVGDVPGAVSDDATPEHVLAAALTLALTDADAQDPSLRSERATSLEDLLLRSSLIEVDRDPSGPADTVLLLTGSGDTTPPPDDGDDSAPTPEESAVGILTTLAQTVQELTGASVVAGATVADGDVVSAIRGAEELATEVTTVSGIETPAGRIVVPLALAASAGGHVGQYGFEDDATVLPPVVEPTPASGGPVDGSAPEGGR